MASLSFKRYGAGEPLVILHGLYGSSDNWVSVARELSPYFSVYLLDLRNHGDSPHYVEHNYTVMIDDLTAFFNSNQIYSTLLLGHSMGGKLAMFYTALFPERVKKLIVVDISPRTYEPALGDNQFIDHENILNSIASIKLDTITSRSQVDADLAKNIKDERVRHFLIKSLKRERDKSFHWKINVEVLKQNLRSVLLGLEDEYDALRHFIGPVVFIRGANSNYIQKDDEHLINKLFLNPKIVTIKNASHWVHAEQHDEFVATVKLFLMA